MTIPASCRRCGVKLTAETDGEHSAHMCDQCALIEFGIPYPGDQMAKLNAAATPAVVRLTWSSTEDLKTQIIHARELFAELRLIPIVDLLKSAKIGQSVVLGTFPLALAAEKREQGRTRHLEVVVEALSAAPNG